MKLEKTTLMICVAVILCILGIVGYKYMNRVPKGDVVVNGAEDKGIIYVHIKGEVKNPGLYEFKYGDRVNDAIKKAGGATDNADIDKVNLAKYLVDGTEITIPDKTQQTSDYGDKINLNTADEKRLQDINGVGESTAEKIIEYREESGGFNSIEEIMNIDGIGFKTFESMKDDITVD